MPVAAYRHHMEQVDADRFLYAGGYYWTGSTQVRQMAYIYHRSNNCECVHSSLASVIASSY